MLDKVIIPEVLTLSCVKTDMSANNKLEVIEKMTDLLYEEGGITNRNKFIEDVFERERLGSTGFENHIAIPHGKSQWVSQTRIAVAKLASPVDWETMDSTDVRLVILFSVKDSDNGSEHIKILAKISMALADDKIVEELLNSKNNKDLYELLINNT